MCHIYKALQYIGKINTCKLAGRSKNEWIFPSCLSFFKSGFSDSDHCRGWTGNWRNKHCFILDNENFLFLQVHYVLYLIILERWDCLGLSFVFLFIGVCAETYILISSGICDAECWGDNWATTAQLWLVGA